MVATRSSSVSRSPSPKRRQAPSSTSASTPGPTPARVPRKKSFSRKSDTESTVDVPESIESSKQNNQLTLSVWRQPILTLHYFGLSLLASLVSLGRYFVPRLPLILGLLAVSALISVIHGPHSPYLNQGYQLALWYGYWTVLGVASSIGLGTGLHTFVLFLGPFIARVTTVSSQCHSLGFTTRGPNAFVCDEIIAAAASSIGIWDILAKVQLEAFFWGAGTAIGELPPYFVARAATQTRPLDALEAFTVIRKKPVSERSISERCQLFVFDLMQRLGFWGILLCASIPNPLFDLAGILSGTFQIPFFTFFGATFIGKAIIKSLIQSFFVVMVFSESTVKSILGLLKAYLPFMVGVVENAIKDQNRKLTGDVVEGGDGIVSILWNGFIFCMIAYFVLSIVEGLAQSKYNEAMGGEASITSQGQRLSLSSSLRKSGLKIKSTGDEDGTVRRRRRKV